MARTLVAVDTATDVGQVAVFTDGVLVHEVARRVSNAHGESLLPLVAEALSSLGLGPRDVGTWAVDVGPGSFTGTRVSLATVKGIVLGTRARAVGLESLDLLAGHQALVRAHPEKIRVGVLPSVRGEVFLAAYDRDGKCLVAPLAVLDPDVPALLASLGPLGAFVLVGARAEALRALPELASCAFETSEPYDVPRAVELGRRVLAGEGKNDISPLYVKPPAIHPGALSKPA